MVLIQRAHAKLNSLRRRQCARPVAGFGKSKLTASCEPPAPASESQDIANRDGDEILAHFDRSSALGNRHCPLPIDFSFNLTTKIRAATNNFYLNVIQASILQGLSNQRLVLHPFLGVGRKIVDYRANAIGAAHGAFRHQAVIIIEHLTKNGDD